MRTRAPGRWCQGRPAVAAALLLALAGPAAADEYRYEDVLVGERAAGLAGAYVAVADDGSAAYHNPAGLVLTPGSHLSLSGSGWQIRAESIRSYLGPVDLVQSSSSIVPSISSAVRDLWGGKGAFSIVVPEFEDYGVDEALSGSQLAAVPELTEARIVRTKSAHTYLVGLSYARWVSERWSLGGTVYFHYRTSVLHRQDWYARSTPDAQGYYSRQVVSDEDRELTALRLFGGVLYHPFGKDGALHLGLTIRFAATATGSVSTRSTQFVQAAPGGPFTRTADDCAASGSCVAPDESVIPSTVEGGAAWTPFSALLVTGQVSYVSAVVTNGQVTRHGVLNWAGGAELKLPGGWAARTGVFTNFTSAPAPSSATTVPEPDQVSESGFTLAGAMTSGPTTSTLGVRVALGSGKTKVVEDDGSTGVRKVDSLAVTFFVGGSYAF